jgi:hypothetical protein
VGSSLLRTPAPLGLVIENVVVIPLCVGAMLLIVVCLGILASVFAGGIAFCVICMASQR